MGGTILCDVTDPRAGPGAAVFSGAVGGRLGLRLVLVLVDSEGDGAAESRLAEIARGLALRTEARLVAGDHVEALARVAAEEGADLIVVGGRPAGLGGRNLRWTLARELEAATPVPVLVAPPSTRRRSDRRLAIAAGADPR